MSGFWISIFLIYPKHDTWIIQDSIQKSLNLQKPKTTVQ